VTRPRPLDRVGLVGGESCKVAGQSQTATSLFIVPQLACSRGDDGAGKLWWAASRSPGVVGLGGAFAMVFGVLPARSACKGACRADLGMPGRTAEYSPPGLGGRSSRGTWSDPFAASVAVAKFGSSGPPLRHTVGLLKDRPCQSATHIMLPDTRISATLEIYNETDEQARRRPRPQRLHSCSIKAAADRKGQLLLKTVTTCCEGLARTVHCRNEFLVGKDAAGI
jgi:hypothetical protein